MKRLFILLGMSLLALPWASPCTAATTNATMSVEELCAHLKENEAKLLNVRVSGQLRAKTYRKGREDVNEVDLTAWFEGRPGGKFKADVSREKLPWEHASEPTLPPFIVTSQVSAFNGRVGQELSRERRNGRIGIERPYLGTSKTASGWGLSFPGCAEDLVDLFETFTNQLSGRSLSEEIVIMTRDKRVVWRVVDESVQGSRVVGIEIQLDGARETIDFDPSRGYAPVKRMSQEGAEVSEFTVEELSEVKPGVFYPRKAIYKSSNGGVLESMQTYCATEIVVNDPTMQESTFDIDWPDEAQVKDKASGFDFKVCRSDEAAVKPKAEEPMQAQKAGENAPVVCMTNYARITIEEYNGTNEVLVIPSTIDGLPVTGIGRMNCANVTSVTIPREVANIEEGAFNRCGRLTAIAVDASNACYSSVDGVLFNKEQAELIAFPSGKTRTYTVPQSVIMIGNSAFTGCSTLGNVVMGSNVTSIGSSAFHGCGLTNIMIGVSVTNIGNGAFADCDDLTDLIIPASVSSLGDGVFRGCEWLKSVSFKGNAPRLGHDVFDDDSEAVVYYERGTKGWRSDFGGRPTDLVWNPEATAK